MFGGALLFASVWNKQEQSGWVVRGCVRPLRCWYVWPQAQAGPSFAGDLELGRSPHLMSMRTLCDRSDMLPSSACLWVAVPSLVLCVLAPSLLCPHRRNHLSKVWAMLSVLGRNWAVLQTAVVLIPHLQITFSAYCPLCGGLKPTASFHPWGSQAISQSTGALKTEDAVGITQV